MITPSFTNDGYTLLEAYAERIDDAKGAALILSDATGATARVDFPAAQWRAHLRIPLPPEGADGTVPYSLETVNARLGIAYLSGRPDIYEKGVRYVWPVPTVDDPMPRAAVHFQPVARWMNDPNGLCYFQGRYHMFYQFNPFGWNWDQMHWGHAVSRDLVHWTHLPVAFDPQPRLYRDRTLTGGAFSGSAIPVDAAGVPCAGDEADALAVFFTRDVTRKDGTESVRDEWQVRAVSRDGLEFSPEECVVSRHSGNGIDGFDINFRDSKVEAVTDAEGNVVHNTMAVATNLEADGPAAPPAAAIALFRTSGPSATKNDWTYCGPGLLDSSHPGTASLECPDYFTLDGVDVACGSLMFYTDPQGRYEPVGWYAGRFGDDGLIQAKERGYCDYGSAWYASQTFLERRAGGQRRLQIGWIPDWHGIRRETPNGANGAMTLPRELHVVDGRLTTAPTEEVYEHLLGDVLFDGECDRATSSGAIPVPGNAWYARIDGLRGEVSVPIARAGGASMTLARTGATVRVATQGAPTDGIDFDLAAPGADTVEIFYDRGIVEVFAGGNAATFLFPDDRADGEAIPPRTDGAQLTVRVLRR